MKIHNKIYKHWTKDDICSILNNEDIRECQTLDFKRTFEFVEATDKWQKIKVKNEFRNDVCSLANADGGDLPFKISEDNGVASNIMPVSIKNIDKFELDSLSCLLQLLSSMGISRNEWQRYFNVAI
jgi:predicted HTH transcriptional regulator